MDQPTSFKDIDFSTYFHHFRNLFWRWKWYILFSCPITGLLAFLILNQFGFFDSPPLPATVLIGLDTKSASSTFNEFASVTQNKERLILSRDFLNKIVNKLSLQFRVKNHSRYDIFDSLRIDSTALCGSYQFSVDDYIKDSYKITYVNKQNPSTPQVIESGTISTLGNLHLPGINLNFNNSFQLEPFSFSFEIITNRLAIDQLLSKMKVTSPNSRDQTYYFSVTLEGNDYPLVAQTLNTIADVFIESNSKMRKHRMKETLITLEKQLSTAERQLQESKKQLQAFLSSNPGVGLQQSTQQIMDELLALESNSLEINNLLNTARDLKNQYMVAPDADRTFVIGEIIAFLQSRGNLSAPSLQNSLTLLINERENAKLNYAKSHPVFSEIDSKIALIGNKTIQILETYSINLNKNISDQSNSIFKITSRLQSLPSKELQLAELKRREEIDGEIYSTILSKFNEAKVAETIEGSDVFVIDYAVQPIPPSHILQLIKSLIIFIGSVLLTGFAPPVVIDLADKTARTENSIISILKLPFLETIPAMRAPRPSAISSPVGNDSDSNDINKHYKRKIFITEPGIHPPYVVELFRSMASKIQLSLYDVRNKILVLTSLDMGEGKSMISTNLALSLADQGIDTVLIDGDMRRGILHKSFSLSSKPGLTDYLSLESPTSKQNLPLQKTFKSNLWVITSGSKIDNPQKLIRLPAFDSLIEQLFELSFFIIIDSPPLGITADAALFSRLNPGYILVTKAGSTNLMKLRKTVTMEYPMVEPNILGVVLNLGQITDHLKYYSYY